MPVFASRFEEVDGFDTLEFGALAITNPYTWPNEKEFDSVEHFVTGKGCYIWPLIFEIHIKNVAKQKQLRFENLEKRIERYMDVFIRNFLEQNPMDFSDSSKQYIGARTGSFQNTRKYFGTIPKKYAIGAAQRDTNTALMNLENDKFIVDPYVELGIFALGAVPFSFTKRTERGDEKYLKIKALLWEFESMSNAEKTEIKFHFLMDRLIKTLRKKMVDALSDQEDE